MKKILSLIFLSLVFITCYAQTTNPQLSTNYTDAMNATVSTWAKEAFLSTFNYNFVDYEKKSLQASRYFTSETWQKFKPTLDKFTYLEEIKEKKLVLVGTIDTPGPTILEQGSTSNGYRWKVQVPATLKYQGPNSVVRIDRTIITMDIINTNEKEGVRGFAINGITIDSNKKI